MSLNLNTAMDAVGTALAGVTGLRVLDYPAENVAVPAAVVDWESIEYDHTHQRGTDRATLKVHVLVGRVSERSARDSLATYVNGTGGVTAAVKAAIDAIGPQVRCQRAVQQVLTMAGSDYRAATFDVDYVA